MKAIPYLMVNNALKAIENYKKAWGAELVEHHPFTEEIAMQAKLPKEMDLSKTTMHAELNIEGSTIFLADDPNAPKKGNVDVLLAPESKEAIMIHYENATKAGFKPTMELQKTFWGAWFGRVVDQDGIGWQLNYMTPPEQ